MPVLCLKHVMYLYSLKGVICNYAVTSRAQMDAKTTKGKTAVVHTIKNDREEAQHTNTPPFSSEALTYPFNNKPGSICLV